MQQRCGASTHEATWLAVVQHVLRTGFAPAGWTSTRSSRYQWGHIQMASNARSGWKAKVGMCWGSARPKRLSLRSQARQSLPNAHAPQGRQHHQCAPAACVAATTCACCLQLHSAGAGRTHVLTVTVCLSDLAGLLASASWDGRLCYWDPRSPAHAGPVLSVTLPGKAYSLTATNSHVIVGTSGRHLLIFNINRCVRCASPQLKSSKTHKPDSAYHVHAVCSCLWMGVSLCAMLQCIPLEFCYGLGPHNRLYEFFVP